MTHRTLILVPEQHGYPHAIARAIAQRMRMANHRVDITDALRGATPPPEGYDAIIFGAEARRPRDRRLLGDYIAGHRSDLERMPVGLFLFCDWRSRRVDPQNMIETFETQVGLRARFAAAMPGSPLSITRNVVRRILLAALATLDGRATDPGMPELTALADAFARDLARNRN